MSTPNPIPPAAPIVTPPVPPKAGLMPSDSTSLSGLGGAVAVIIIAALGAKGITFPAGMEAAIAVIVSTLLGYLPPSGRK